MKMAGKPLTQERLALMDADAVFIYELFADGKPHDRIALVLTDKYEMNVPRQLLANWANSEKHRANVAQARARAADHLAESNLSGAEDLSDRVKVGLADRDDIAAERHLADQRKWIAGVWNKEKYAPQQGANVSINIGEVHLASLRSQPAVAASRPSELLAFDRDNVTDVEAHEVPQTLADLL
jgi:hypothetical protein